MLSILIPIYNFDVRKLVNRLHTQGLNLDIPFEIIGVEDASSADFVQLNQELKLPYFTHKVLAKNVGRSKIRNLLAQFAQYDYLLFMDCDSMPTNSNYLNNYAQQLNPKQLLYGGRCYATTPPQDLELYFHWHYGTQREQSTAIERQKAPHQSFMTNNFLIPKAIFEQIKFDEQLTQYGHEDTLFGLELKKRNIFIQHLDNPLEHIGLEKNSTFIRKSEQAIQNLHTLHQQYDLGQGIKLLSFYLLTKKFYLHSLIAFFYTLSKRYILNNLYSSNPKLRLFDIYKLGYFIKWEKTQYQS